ncbi:sulfite exporter TauE/SafE family protein [Blautia sp. MSJ-19]|uniref:sulfite exporter TauE/SafE family protein n=1 Tax=Blautia sp. MSJ-19 TaxID=2841517 RepID=UPI001C0EE605|nr:sulfite exporter TauE/SafE family protein [Blautia sp. MSJ-19]MBU5480030.1 sulfite exporter TauE/SafE family protein [Blautia sp. MSJ-19]
MSTLTLLTLVIIGAANMAVGGCIGICGIAGFLLPMLYSGALGFDVTYALALSFLAFLVSGIIGSFNYYKAGNLDIKMSIKLGIGSLIGAVGGVFLQSMIEKSTAKTILYLVVLFSGASILVRMWNEKRHADRATSGNTEPTATNNTSTKTIADNVIFLVFLGITTGAICSLSGAGGPVLVMPLLVACGVSARIAVGVALFDSVFIAVPACIGYLSRISWSEILELLVLIIITHGIGVWLGSRFAGKVPVQGLKIFVAVFSVCIAIYMLF